MADAVDVVIVASAFGMDAVRTGGHLKWAQASRRAGAAGFEVRRELFADEADAAPQRLRALGGSIAELGLWSVFSTPASLYTSDGQLDARRTASRARRSGGARRAFRQAATRRLRARRRTARRLLSRCSGAARICGSSWKTGNWRKAARLRNSPACSTRSQREGHADVLGMTFDIGNWAWRDVAPLDAAEPAGGARRIHPLQDDGGRGRAALSRRAGRRRRALRRGARPLAARCAARHRISVRCEPHRARTRRITSQWLGAA